MRAASLALLMAPCFSLLMAPCLALNLVEMKPLAAAMLAKRWATDQAELDQKVGIRDDGVTGVLRFGDDLKRRTEVAKALDLWQKTSLALAAAAKEEGRSLIRILLSQYMSLFQSSFERDVSSSIATKHNVVKVVFNYRDVSCFCRD